MLNISEPATQTSLLANQPWFEHPFFDLLFRSYFILGMLASVVSLFIWLAYLSGYYLIGDSGLSPLVWHTHEMLFGFAATIAVAFILTAVQTWTGLPSIRGKWVVFLVTLWLGIRALVWINTTLTIQLALILQVIWWLSTVWIFSKLVFKSQNRRNYLFAPLLCVMGTCHCLILFADLNGDSELALHLAKSVVLLFTLLMTIVGGRVIPFFTVKGAQTQPITNIKIIEILLLFVSLLSIVIFIVGYFVTLPLTPAVFLIAASILHLIRLNQWRSSKTLTVMLLWSLHLAYLFMSLGLFFLGISYFDVGVTFSSALHLITVGAIGLMILSMMSRVSLGHTGRLLQPKKVIGLALSLMAVAAITRAFLPLIGLPMLAWQISTLFWGGAGVIFILVYWPILTSAKVIR